VEDVQDRRKEVLEMEEHGQNKIKGKISLTDSKIIFFSIPFDAGWTATVDGEEVRPMLANLGFLGLPLEPGEHRIELRFRIPYFFPGLLISLLSLFLYLAIVFFRRRA